MKAVLFDLDGTLLNRDASLEAFIRYQYDRFPQVVGHIPKDVYCEAFIKFDQRGYVWKDKVYQRMISEFKLKGVTPEELLHDYVSEFKHHCVPFPNLVAMLEELTSRNLTLGIISNGFGQFQMDNIKALGIHGYFDAIFISEWEGLKKPEANLFYRALSKLGASPEESLFIGDHPENDVHAAKRIGMKGVWKKDNHWETPDADAVIDDLIELPRLLDKLEPEKERKH